MLQLPTSKPSSVLFALPVSCCPDGGRHGWNSPDGAKERRRHMAPARTLQRIPSPPREPQPGWNRSVHPCSPFTPLRPGGNGGAFCSLGSTPRAPAPPESRDPAVCSPLTQRSRRATASAVTLGWLGTSGKPEAERCPHTALPRCGRTEGAAAGTFGYWLSSC